MLLYDWMLQRILQNEFTSGFQRIFWRAKIAFGWAHISSISYSFTHQLIFQYEHFNIDPVKIKIIYFINSWEEYFDWN